MPDGQALCQNYLLFTVWSRASFPKTFLALKRFWETQPMPCTENHLHIICVLPQVSMAPGNVSREYDNGKKKYHNVWYFKDFLSLINCNLIIESYLTFWASSVSRCSGSQEVLNGSKYWTVLWCCSCECTVCHDFFQIIICLGSF